MPGWVGHVLYSCSHSSETSRSDCQRPDALYLPPGPKTWAALVPAQIIKFCLLPEWGVNEELCLCHICLCFIVPSSLMTCVLCRLPQLGLQLHVVLGFWEITEPWLLFTSDFLIHLGFIFSFQSRPQFNSQLQVWLSVSGFLGQLLPMHQSDSYRVCSV